MIDNDPTRDHTQDYLNGGFLPPAPKIRTSSTVTDQSIRAAYSQWQGRQGRFQFLWRYLMGYQRDPRGGDRDKAFVVSNLCEYVVKTIKGYMVGNRPMFKCAEGDSYGQAITEMFEEQNLWEVVSRVVQHLSTYGRAFVLTYLNDDMEPRAVVIDPRDGFVAYSGDIEQDSVFGLIRYTEYREDGSRYYRFYVYTQTELQLWHTEGEDNEQMVQDRIGAEEGGTETGGRPHGFTRVPLIEFANNDEYRSDFESIIGLQDAYNMLQGDRLDDKNAFAESILLIQGFLLGDDAEDVQKKNKNLKKTRTLQMPDDGTASYLTKTLDEANVQILQNHLTKDIHKLAMVPDLSDEQFSGNASGVAMAYKLFGTDQVVSEKNAQIQKGYTRLCKLYDEALNNASLSPDYEPRADISGMSIQFVYNIVQDVSYMATAVTQLVQAGVMSKQTAMEALSLIDDPDEEMVRLAKDNEEARRNAQAMFEDDYQGLGKPSDADEDTDKDTDKDADEDDERMRRRDEETDEAE
jgi:SPP1 family phage portal protein